MNPPLPGQGELFEVPYDSWRLRYCRVCRGGRAITHPQHVDNPVFTYVMRRQHWLKIGKSYTPENRRKVLSMPCPGCRVVSPAEMEWSAPIVILLLLDGDVEHDLHERWRDRHVVGEWFLPDPPMLAWLTAELARQTKPE